MKTLMPVVLLGAALTVAGCNSNTPQNNETASAPEAATTNTTANAPAEPARAFGRGLHLVPGMGPISLVSSGQKFAGNLTYGNATPFEGIKEEKVKIEAYGGDGKSVAGPMPLTLDSGEDFTVLVTGLPGDVELMPFKHKNHGPQAGKAKVAFAHAAKVLPRVDVTIDGKPFRRDVKYGINTDYTVLPPGRHTMQVSYDKSLAPLVVVVQVEQPTVITEDTSGNVVSVEQPTPVQTVIPRKGIVTLTQDLDLIAGKVYSVAIFNDEKKLPKMRLLEDKFVPTLSTAKPAEQ